MSQANEIVAQAVSILAAVASRGANVAQGAATQVLGNVVTARLRRDGQGAAWEEFKRNPRNDSLLRHLLTQAVLHDAEFRNKLARAVAAATKEQPRSSATAQTITFTGSGEAQIGNRGDTFKGGRVATRGASYHEDNRVSNKKSSGGFVTLAVVALVVILVVVLAVKVVPTLINKVAQGDSLTAGSTCQQFLNADEQTEEQALVNIAMSKGIGGFGSPLALPEIRFECSSEPTMTLGALVERDRNEFG